MTIVITTSDLIFSSFLFFRLYLQDFGSLFPGHGGLLDRLDSYIFVGPMAFVFVTNFVLPRL